MDYYRREEKKIPKKMSSIRGKEKKKCPGFSQPSILQFPTSVSIWLNLAKLSKGAWETVEKGEGMDVRTNRQWFKCSSTWTAADVRERKQNFIIGKCKKIKEIDFEPLTYKIDFLYTEFL